MAYVQVDRTNYDKATKHPPVWTGLKWDYYGWHPRKSLPLPTRILMHTTNGPKGSALTGEARFLLNSPKVSAHYLVGKSGQVIRFLNPALHVAWHAGACLRGWSNNETIGIEMHYTPGEIVSHACLRAAALLVLDLCAVYEIGDLHTHLGMHRDVGWPKGRKIDPSNLSDLEWLGWQANLHKRRVKYGIGL